MELKKDMGVTTLMVRGGGVKEVVGLPASPQKGGGKGIDRRTYS